MRNDQLLSYASGASVEPLRGQTIGDLLVGVVREFPEREALVESFSGRRWSFAELLRDVDALASQLVTAGIQRGDRVGIWSPNCAEWVIVQYATARIGAILVNINPAYRSSELQYLVSQSRPRLIFSAVAYRDTDYAGMLAEIDFEDVVFIGSPEWERLLASVAGDEAERLTDRLAELSFDQAINIQYTSGTTGFPKGATLSHHNILNNGYSVGEGLHYTEHDRLCLPVPLYHCFGMVMGILGAHSHGAAVVLPAPVFDPIATLQSIETEGCTALYGVPTMFIAELDCSRFDEFDLSSLRTGIMAGSPCPVDVMERVIARMHMAEVAICYGMTETSPVSTMTARDDDLATRTTTIGQVMPHLEVKVVDSEGRVVPRGTPGELCTRGYSVMLGYWNEPEKTAEVIDDARWMRTGDIAVMDDAQRLSVVGRIKDMIIRGGENIYPREIEEFLYRHSDISDVQVIGVPDEKYGEELMAWIIMRPGASALDASDIAHFCRGRLSHFKIPRYVRVVDSFPTTVTGKVRKIEMREIAERLLRPTGATVS